MPAAARPLRDLCETMEPLRKVADLPYVKPVVRVKPRSEGVKPGDVVFTIAARSGAIRVPAAADGAIDFPLTDALCAENPELSSNQPEGSVGLSVTIDPQVPPAKSFDYRLLESLRRQWDEALSRQKLAYRLLAPSPKGFHVAFGPGRSAGAEIRLPHGVRKLVADANGDLVIPFEPSWVEANPSIVLTELPRRIGLRFKG